MIAPKMPSPIGHALAGLAAAWAVDLVPGDRAWRTAPEPASWFRRAGDGLTLACGALGAAADLDHLFITHRTVTHSIGAIAFVGLFAAAVAANAQRPVARVALMCAAAYSTHLLLDWLGVDTSVPRGIQALWPFSHEWFISGIDLFPKTERHELLTVATTVTNLKAIVQEVLIVGPPTVALWLVRVKALSRLPSEMARRDHAAK
jgi:inner membrane protein